MPEPGGSLGCVPRLPAPGQMLRALAGFFRAGDLRLHCLGLPAALGNKSGGRGQEKQELGYVFVQQGQTKRPALCLPSWLLFTHSDGHVLWVELCHPKSPLFSHPAPHNVTLFGDRVIAGMIS